MTTTQKMFLGGVPVIKNYLGETPIISSFSKRGPVIDNTTVLYLDGTISDSYPGSGNTWFDLSGNGNDANVTNTAATWDTGSNLYFDAEQFTYAGNATVTHDSSLNVFDGDFTIQMVATVDQEIGGGSDLCGLIAKVRFDSNPGWGHVIIRNSADGNYKKNSLYINGTSYLSTGTVFNNLGDWFVLQFIRSGSTVKVYSNNVEISSFTNSSNANNSSNIIIGNVRDAAADAYRWIGKYTNIGIYDKALSEVERVQNLQYYKEQLGF
jgi:hypothetical protein